jgi:hypothetical protein
MPLEWASGMPFSLPPSAFAGDGRKRPASYGISPRQRLRRAGEEKPVLAENA